MLVLESASGEPQTKTAGPWGYRDNQGSLYLQDVPRLDIEKDKTTQWL